VADHENPACPFGEVDQLSALGDVQTERLLDQDIFAGLERAAHKAAMSLRGGRDDDAFERIVAEKVLDALSVLGSWVLLGYLVQDLGSDIANPGQGSDIIEIPDEVATPVPAPDTADAGSSPFQHLGPHWHRGITSRHSEV
jgi:hypothetical protein